MRHLRSAIVVVAFVLLDVIAGGTVRSWIHGASAISPTCTESGNFIARTSSASPAQQAAWDGFICRGVNFAGNGGPWWPVMDVIQLYAANNASNAVLNLVSTSYTGNFVNNPTFIAGNGVFSNGVSPQGYVDTGVNPSTAGGNYTQNSAHVSVCTTAVGGSARLSTEALGITPALSAQQINIYPQFSDGFTYGRINDNGSTVGVPNPLNTTTGFWLINRTGSAATTMYRNATVVGSPNGTSAALANTEITVAAQGATADYGGLVMAFTAGGSLTAAQEADLSDAIHTYMVAVGAPSCGASYPTVALTSPTSGANLVGTVSLTTTASDSLGLTNVQFLLDGATIGGVTTLPYSYTFDSTTVGDGSHMLSAKATNVATLATITTAIPITTTNGIVAPTIAITSPMNGDTVSGSAVSFTATVTEGSLATTSVQWFVDSKQVNSTTSAPYSYTWNSTTVVDGTHVIWSIANNSRYSTTSSSISVTTSNGVNPNVYYFANAGSDTGNNCKTQVTPCQTIAKLNSLTYVTADQIKLNGGDNFTDACIVATSAHFSGNRYYPVTITSYGTGVWTLTAPCTGDTGAVLIDNAPVEVTNGVLVGPGNSALRAGVKIQANLGNTDGAVVENMTIGGFGYVPTNYGGEIFLQENSPPNNTIKNLSILNNTLAGLNGPTSTDDNGLHGNGGAYTGGIISGNLVYNIGAPAVGNTWNGTIGNGITMTTFGSPGSIDEFNLAHDVGANTGSCGGPSGNWIVGTSNATLQFNEVYNVKPSTYTTGCDWDGYDIDINSASNIMQYNYSHNNFGAGFLQFQGGTWSNNVVRYNTSENNSGRSAGFGELTFVQGGASSYTYNNTGYSNVTYSGGASLTCDPGVVFQNGSSITGIFANNVLNVGHCSDNSFRPINSTTPGFAPNPSLYIIAHNDMISQNGGSFTLVWANTGYSSIASWQAFYTGGIGNIAVAPTFASPPSGNCTWTPSTTSTWPPSGCPSAYSTIAAGLKSSGLDLTQAPYNLTVGTRDYYADTIPGTGPCYNIGAYGACP